MRTWPLKAGVAAVGGIVAVRFVGAVGLAVLLRIRRANVDVLSSYIAREEAA